MLRNIKWNLCAFRIRRQFFSVVICFPKKGGGGGEEGESKIKKERQFRSAFSETKN